MREYAASVTAILAAVIVLFLSVFFTSWGIGKIIFCTYWSFMLTYPAVMLALGRR